MSDDGEIWVDPSGALIEVPRGVEDLPPADTRRWVIRRKAEVVTAVRAGIITAEEACRRYSLTAEELESWRRLIETHGLPGLRATRLQRYRGGAGKRTRLAEPVAPIPDPGS